MRNLRFKKDDFLFIRTTYPSLFIKFKNSYEENNKIKFYSYNHGKISFMSEVSQDYYDIESNVC